MINRATKLPKIKKYIFLQKLNFVDKSSIVFQQI